MEMLKSILYSAKCLAARVNLGYAISSLDQCNSKFYCDLYNSLTGEWITYEPHLNEGEKCQLVIDLLEKYMHPHINLDHIKGTKLALHDELSIKNVLDIFSILVGANSISEVSLKVTGSQSPPSPPHTPPQSVHGDQHINDPIHQSTPHIRFHSRVFLPSSKSSSQLSSDDHFMASSNIDLSHSPLLSLTDPNGIEPSLKIDQPKEDSVDGFSGSDDIRVLTSLYHNYVRELRSLSNIHRKSQESTDDRAISTSLAQSTSELCLEPHATRRKSPCQLNTQTKDVLKQTESAFPYVYSSPSTMRYLRKRQGQQSLALLKPPFGPSSLHNKVESMQQKQKLLLEITQKQLAYARHCQQQLLRKYQEQCVKRTLQSKRVANARAHRYFHDYEVQLKSKLQKARTKEEQTFINTFREGLKIQKEKVISDWKYAKEKRILMDQQICKEFDAMEQNYRDKFTLLARIIDQEKKEMKNRERTHKMMLDRVKREFRNGVEEEIKQMQLEMHRDDDIQHFRELDALKCIGD